MKPFYFLLLLFIISSELNSQNWSTFAGNNSRSGQSLLSGPTSLLDLKWKITDAGNTTLGNAIYSFGNRFVTSRVTFSPYVGYVECRDLENGSLHWKSPNILPTSILYCIGMTNDAVYVNDYSNGDIFALRIADGKVLWKSAEKSYIFGAYPGCVFACNGDPIIGGEPGKSNFTMRLDKRTGKTKWINKTLIAITPNSALACNETKIYRITGGITLPIKLTSLDIESGKTLYSSEAIPGDGDQENPITLGKDGMIYFKRDGGLFYAFRDNGMGFEIVWTYNLAEISGAALSGNVSIGPDQNIYIFDNRYILKLDHKDGSVIESSLLEFNMSQASLNIDADTNIYFNTGLGQFYCLSSNLQEVKWFTNANNNVYSNMGLGKEGIMVLTQGGKTILAYQTNKLRKCIADFSVNKYQVQVGEELSFTDQSSYMPVEWEWIFSGADISKSFQQNPSGIKYSKVGIYDVGLKVKNKYGENETIKNCLIEVINSQNAVANIKNSEIFIYPNPATDFLNIKITELVEQEIVIVNTLGQKIKTAQLRSGINPIYIEHLSTGIYFIYSLPKRDINTSFIKK